MPIRSQILEKYLRHYAEPEAAEINGLNLSAQAPFQYCLVIPCYDETEAFITRLAEHCAASEILTIVVINKPVDAVNSEINAVLFRTLTANKHTKNSGRLYFTQHRKLRLIVVDRFTPGNEVDTKRGVGLARKIGCDIACTLWQQACIKSSLIYSSDADAHLPENYFTSLNSPELGPDSRPKIGAYVFDFTHLQPGDVSGSSNASASDKTVAQATLAYEKSIKYYRDGLAWANSPYAFYALGSCIAIDVESYSQVRGFPQRAAGEDFYLLNKIAKLTVIEFWPQVKICLEPRLSHRVPFGTGPAVEALINSQQALKSYDPAVFFHLKQFLHWAKECLSDLVLNPSFNYDELLQNNKLESRCLEAADALGFASATAHLTKQCKDQHQVLTHFNIWFDGFRTLKFIHYLQNHFYPQKTFDLCIKDFDQLQKF